MTIEDFEWWLRSYGHAWESRDAEEAATLFGKDALYYQNHRVELDVSLGQGRR